MNGSLNIYKSTQQPDYTKSGYFKNTVTGVPLVPDGKLLPFYYFFSDAVEAYSVVNFELIHIKSNTTYELATGWCNLFINSDGLSYITYQAGIDILNALPSYFAGLYKYRIVINTGAEFFSEIFEINTCKSVPVVGVGDFSPTAFNNAFSRPE